MSEERPSRPSDVARAALEAARAAAASRPQPTRRRIAGPAGARKLARSMRMPVYDVQIVGYPQLMRDHDARQRILRDRERELLARLEAKLQDSAQAASAASGGHRVHATVLVVRALDVDRLAPSEPVQETLELLSDWGTLMLAAIEGHGGRVTQHAGDSVGATFGATDPAPGGGAAAASVRLTVVPGATGWRSMGAPTRAGGARASEVRA